MKTKRGLILSIALALLASVAFAQTPPELLEKLNSADAKERQTARQALVKLGPAAIPALFARLASVPAADDVPAQVAANAVVQGAARPGNERQRGLMSAALLKEAKGGHPLPTRRYAMELLWYVAGPESVPALSQLLRDRELGDMALRALARNPGKPATSALTSALDSTTGDLKLGVMGALGERHDRTAVPALKKELASENVDERIAARRALSRIPTYPDVKIEKLLRPTGKEPKGRERREAINAYLRLAETGESVSPNGERVDIRIYRYASRQSDLPAVRAAGVRGLARVGGLNYVPMVIRALGDANPQVRGAARSALAERRDITNLLLAAAEKEKPKIRVHVFALLARRGSKAATPILVKAAGDDDAAIAAAAVEALATLRDPAAANDLARIAETGPEALRPAALRGYLLLAGADKDGARAEAAFNRGLKLASRDEERRLALIGLASLARPSSLPTVLPYLKNDALRSAAAAAVATIADIVAKTDEARAKELYRQALVASADRGLRRRIAERLRGLGVTIDLAAEQGFVTQWWVLGPFSDRAKFTTVDPFDVKMADPAKPVTADGQTYRWKPSPLGDPDGMVDLERAIARRSNCVGYLYAEVTSDKAQDVLFKIGSDDGFVLWVNGVKVGQNIVDRGYTRDQDTVKAKLTAGVNRILIKVTQGGAQWAVGVRITTPSGAPLRLKQRPAK